MRISIGLTAAAALAASLVAPSGAAAATEVGSNCTGDSPGPGTLIVLANPPGSPFPASVPAAGVATKWKVNFGVFVPAGVPQILKVVRPTGAPNEFRAIAEAAGTVFGGTNVFDIRIPVQAGDRFGLVGAPVTIYCIAAPGNVMGAFNGNLALGESKTFVEAKDVQVPVTAVVEPDADGDGYGDESQDKCPLSAAVQVECPVVVLDTYALPKKGKVVVLVASDTSTQVTVSGTAKLPRSSKGAKSSAQAKLRKVKRSVTAGKISRFTLNFPASLKSAIAGLAPGKSISLKLEATATDVAGRVAKDKASLKLKG